ncbi:hypothetical protein BpOF4_09410 [Alkalihalophilus pseudofirmus OF4]|uniref:Uncharacterized protein n=2 Tax=Alkalihalophilus pseudofirmus TaxID=79885 RepID=D3FSG9_ALKPO|nr:MULTISPECIES: hypothetical protein [Alkalihalophilus]ADC49937.1 hypothetical protein BpOF4_09410 [Alkalihalophilus pseudofirmus OF4]MDV2887165.1 hypothetical protein [Alkalihalophilus pseudofirmus]MED1602056.1 hypothetical protein [Alkalihalophilus marmarensis]OLS34910.1 hypothetical protein BTR22_17145 [Alkalihalophilus pseudofirmus]WEG17248.1 hypothetical protein PQ478_01675 [Alkalihalophilus pseudofirmus]
MRYEEFKLSIIESKPSDWLYDQDTSVYVFKDNISITIDSDITVPSEGLSEDWISAYEDDIAYEKFFNLRYNGVAIERFRTVAVDGFRVFIPYPDKERMTITEEQYRIADILNLVYNGPELLDYFGRGDLSVVV